MEVQSRVVSYCVKPELMEVLKSAGAKGDNFTIKEVLDYLRDYITDRVLFDLKEPRRIRCENDQLGKAFGVKMFTVADVPKLVFTNLIPNFSIIEKEKVLGESTHCSGNEKRKLEDNQSDDEVKKQRGEHSKNTSQRRSPWFMYICPTPDYDSGSESVWSVQGYETAIVKDSSDDTWYYETEEEFEVGFSDADLVEFEVNSLSSGIDEMLSDTESEVTEVMSAAILLCQDDSDQEFWADSSSNEQLGASDSDPEITDGDKWKCQHCMALNKPLIRFCQKCWQLRNGWLPERRRPKRRHKRLTRTLSAPEGVPLENLGKRKTSQSLSDFSAEEELRINGSVLNNNECSGSLDSVPSTSGTVSPQDSQLCSICLTRPKNASIVHGRTGHVISCYGCGMKLWERKGTCPVCRRTIQKVIQNFIV